MIELILSDITVTISDRVSRGKQKAFNRILFKNATTNQDGKTELSLSQIDEANDVLILEMITKIVDNKTKEEKKITIEWLDAIDQNDYEVILEKIKKIREEKNNIKKK